MASEDHSDGTDYFHQHNLSRLSLCTTNSFCDDAEKYYSPDEYAGSGGGMLFPAFSFQSLEGDADADADEELSAGWVSEFDDELGYSSLPPTPHHARKRSQSEMMMMAMSQKGKGEKEYASENEVHKTATTTTRRRRRRSSATVRGWVLDEANSWDCSNFESDGRSKTKGERDKMGVAAKVAAAGSGGESESSGVVVITRPKGGSRSLCMGLEEVKACRDLGFELEHERMLEMASRVSISASTLDTSSGSNSPIASWCISSPGDDPRDVKARLKVWAQAVALASTSLTH